MRKTTFLVDNVKVRRAQEILGTTGIEDTIDRALDEVLALAARRRELKRLERLSRDNLEAMRNAWRS
jgi:hypothetical protein